MNRPDFLLSGFLILSSVLFFSPSLCVLHPLSFNLCLSPRHFKVVYVHISHWFWTRIMKKLISLHIFALRCCLWFVVGELSLSSAMFVWDRLSAPCHRVGLLSPAYFIFVSEYCSRLPVCHTQPFALETIVYQTLNTDKSPMTECYLTQDQIWFQTGQII